MTEQPDPLTKLIKDLGVSSRDYKVSVCLNTVVILCPRPGVCNGIWRKFYALQPRGYGILISYPKNGGIKRYVSSKPLRD